MILNFKKMQISAGSFGDIFGYEMGSFFIQVARRTKGGAGAKQKTDKVPEKELGEKNNSNISTSLCKQCIAMFAKHATFIQGNLKKALAMTDKPMKVNSECQQYRKSRIGELQVFYIVLWMEERMFRN